MNRGRSRSIFASVAVGLWMILFTAPSFSAEEAKAPEPAKAEAPAAAPSAPAAAAPAPKLPSYFTATSDDPKKPPAWPDPTGGASGVWATPAGDAKGDVPDQLKTGDLYDRIAHNLYSINFVWVLICGLPRDVHAGWLHDGRNRSVPGEKFRPHRRDESDDLSARLLGILGLRLRHRLG